MRSRHTALATAPARDRLIPLGHRVYVLPCDRYAVIKGCGRDLLTGEALYIVLSDDDGPSWAADASVIDCGDPARFPRALLAPGGRA